MALVSANQFQLTPDISGAISQGLNAYQQTQAGQMQKSQFQTQQAAAERARLQDRFKSVAQAAVQAQALPDDQSRINFLENRVSQLNKSGVDSSDTQEALDLYKAGRTEEANALINSAVETGVRTGVLSQGAQEQGGFSLSPGQVRYDSSGNVIAQGPSVAESPSLALEQQKLIQRQQEQQFREEQAASKSQELSPTVQKILDAAQTEAVEAGNRSRSMAVLASDISNTGIGGGIEATTTEKLKGLLGTQDDVSELRRRFNAVRASQAVQNLPPGPASDKDIQLALSGFPKENAGGQQIAAFLRGASKLEAINAAYQTFKSDMISTSRSTKGLLQKWKGKVTSEALGRDIQLSELYITAQEEGMSINEVKEMLGVR